MCHLSSIAFHLQDCVNFFLGQGETMGTSCTSMPRQHKNFIRLDPDMCNRPNTAKTAGESQKSSYSSLTYRSTQSNTTSKRSFKKRRKRKIIRHKSFEFDASYSISLIDQTQSKITRSTVYHPRNMGMFNMLDYNLPILPIIFSKDSWIWTQEYNLFVDTLSNLLHLRFSKFSKCTLTKITKTILEFNGTDILFNCHSNHLQIPRHRGLWPQHYILRNANNQKLNERGGVFDALRDKVIKSFNFRSIFQSCGIHYNTETNMRKFFAHGQVPTAPSEHCAPGNPLSFKVYSHDLMVLNVGFFIERHCEFYEECQDEKLFYFTLMLLPPNIASYKGGSYRFYGVRAGESECVEISADCENWSWIMFDKRVEYECDVVVSGAAVSFEINIDVWLKDAAEIKQIERSQTRMSEVVSSELSVDLNEINNAMDADLYMFDSPTLSPNIVFPPFPVSM